MAAPQQPLFYKRVTPLSRERHKDLYLEPQEGFEFSRSTNSVYVAAVEFPPASREMPIVFAPARDGAVMPVALLGLKPQQNLMLDASARWVGRYIPAYIRRYPFILAVDEGGRNYTVCIDEAHTGFNTAREGERLMAEDGTEGPLLERSIAFLKDYQGQVQRTEAFCRELVASAVLEPMQANVEMASGEKFSLSGFQCVSRERLKALADDRLAALVRNDFLELVYAHLASLTNMQALIERMRAA